MRYRILRNECYKYRIESQHFDQEWELLMIGRPGGLQAELEFKTFQEARDHITEIIEAPELERKRNAWRVIETVEAPDEQENT